MRSNILVSKSIPFDMIHESKHKKGVKLSRIPLLPINIQLNK